MSFGGYLTEITCHRCGNKIVQSLVEYPAHSEYLVMPCNKWEGGCDKYFLALPGIDIRGTSIQDQARKLGIKTVALSKEAL